MKNVLEIQNLRVAFEAPRGIIRAVEGVSLSVAEGECLALVGESGCGKSVTSLAAMRLLDESRAVIRTDRHILCGEEISGLPEKRMQELRGSKAAMIFQDALSALNPVMTVGRQIDEIFLRHTKLSKKEARERSVAALAAVGIPDAAARYRSYPHELSGGMRQRVLIAMAFACKPELIIADEPTTALDVTIQAQILELLRRMQKIFQDPATSLSPRFTVERAIAEPMVIRGGFTETERREKVREMLSLIGLSESDMPRYVTEFSGGQKQRKAIARALILHPDYIVCDEPVSALDVSVHAQILNLLKDLGGRFGLTYLFISHNLAAVRRLCGRIAIMYLGHIVEYGDTAEIFARPMHPYTKALISAVLTVDAEDASERMILKGDIASPIDLPRGCVFAPRCPFACEECKSLECRLTELGEGHFAACPRALKGEITL